jgi:hypothetical protein
VLLDSATKNLFRKPTGIDLHTSLINGIYPRLRHRTNVGGIKGVDTTIVTASSLKREFL